MNITNLEVTQAAIDMFFCLVCIIMVVSIRANNPKQKSMKSFVHLFLIAAFLFLGETLAYIFRGNLGVFNVTITRASNLVVFAMNVAMANTYVRYVQAVFTDRGAEVSDKYIKVGNVFSLINILIIAVNLVYPWMYYFDEANYYHRNNMWYVYTILSLVIIFSGASMAIRYRKNLEIRSFVSVMLFSFIPIIATIVQLFVYGLSITNLGLGIGSFIMFAAYIYDWSHDSVEQMEKIKNNRFDVVVLFVIMLLSMSVSIIACGNVIQRVTRDNSKMQSETIAQMVDAEIENEFIKPVTVSQTISQDLTIRSYIAGSTKEEAEAVKDEMTAHLVSIGNEFGYQMVFVASEKTRAYYTYNGISKYLDVENDSHDIWYKDFLDSGKKYVINVDTDENNNWDLAVFVNYGIFDDSGNVLGACGAGVNMNDLMNLIAKYEDRYGIKIDLVNHDGLIQIDSDGSAIEVGYLDNSYFDKVTGTDFYYQTINGSCYMTKYIDEFDWYLVVRDDNPVKIDANRILLPIILIFIAGVVIMAITFAIVSIRQRKTEEAYNNRYEVSIKDELTGLYNRRGFEVDCDEINRTDTLGEYSIIMMDLNGLKSANDNIGHEAGDELIIGAAKCMSNAFAGLGNVYRVGGDEFVALLKGKKASIEASVTTLDYLTSKFKGKLISELSVSKGVVVCSEYPDLSFEELKAMADKLMYADKDEYYRRTGKNRRRV
ncbi:MAG: sensor domain-containing diguanylate cyclase [Lachnospiraceae bacterium]|nr:sensor domain-containing diguanylate cyclase [Lachnospiraceae bacterium]